MSKELKYDPDYPATIENAIQVLRKDAEKLTTSALVSEYYKERMDDTYQLTYWLEELLTLRKENKELWVFIRRIYAYGFISINPSLSMLSDQAKDLLTKHKQLDNK